MPSNHLILCRPLLLLPSIFPSIRVFSNKSALCIRWPKYWSFCFSISPSNEYAGLISLIDWRIQDWLVWSPYSPRDSQNSSPTPQFISINSLHSAFFTVQLSHPYMTTGKTIALTRRTFVVEVMSLLFNMLSRLVIAFLPRSKCLLISWLQSPSIYNSPITEWHSGLQQLQLFLLRRESMLVWVIRLRCHWYCTSFWFWKTPVFHEDCGTFQTDSESLEPSMMDHPSAASRKGHPSSDLGVRGSARGGSCSGIIITIFCFPLTWQPQAPMSHCLVMKHAYEKQWTSYQNRRCVPQKKLSFIHPTGTAPPRRISLQTASTHSSEGPLRQSLTVSFCKGYSRLKVFASILAWLIEGKEATFTEIKYNQGVRQQNGQVNPDASAYCVSVLKRN